jgi:molybdate transport system substrate-binding protein
MKRVTTAVTVVALGGLVAACTGASHQESRQSPTLTVSAAADLTFALKELGGLFQNQTEVRTVFNFGSTGQLAQQIEQGAPVDVFLAANVAYVDDLERKGLTVPGTKAIYARGRIALWVSPDSSLRIERIADLTVPEIKRVAIANPDHAPYGMAAREALQSAGIWEALQPRLVLGENVRQALQYAETGNVDVAIVALSLSITSKGRWTLIPEELHRPIDQALAVIRGTKFEQEARRFGAFVLGPQGRPIMRKYGFVMPGEVPVR